MNSRNFAPINVGKVAPAPKAVAEFMTTSPNALTYRPNLRVLEEAMDEVGEYAQAMKTPRWIPPGDYDALVTRNEVRETTIRRLLNNDDQADAVDWLVARGEISSELAERIEEVSLEFTEKRLNRGEQA